ncbi:hypothetical protein TNCV_1864841 [Trichonephila clavipes]|nr:hypothetical protein TNCV_1864841 [Trichonephila clavipes]
MESGVGRSRQRHTLSVMLTRHAIYSIMNTRPFRSGDNTYWPIVPTHQWSRTTVRRVVCRSGARANDSGQGIRSWLACHEFEPSTTKDPPSSGAMHVKSVDSSNILLWCGIWRGVQLTHRCRPR